MTCFLIGGQECAEGFPVFDDVLARYGQLFAPVSLGKPYCAAGGVAACNQRLIEGDFLHYFLVDAGHEIEWREGLSELVVADFEPGFFQLEGQL